MSKFLGSLQGLGFVSKDSAGGTGSLSLSGYSTVERDVAVKVSTSGELGTAQFQVSVDGGAYGVAATVPSSGEYSLSGTGVTLVFAAGPTGAGTSFVLGDIYSFELTTPSFPTTAWQSGSVPRTLAELYAKGLAELARTIAGVAAGGLLLEADDDWLDLLAASLYKRERNLGTTTAGTVTLANAGASPKTVHAGQVWVGTTGGKRYLNTTGGTIAAGGTLSVTVQAEAPGSAYNVANGTITVMYTVLPSVTVSNSPSTGSWITTSGSDRESDESLRQRCRARWPELGTGATALVIEAWCKEADPTVTRVTVTPQTGADAGKYKVRLATDSGGVSGGVVAAVQTYLDYRASLTTTPVVESASVYNFQPVATVRVRKGYLASAQVAVVEYLTAFAKATPIGGFIYQAAVIEQLMLAEGVYDCTYATANIDLADTEVAVLNVSSLTFQEET